MTAATIHASAVLVGARAILIRGPSGSGKSQLVLALLQAAERGTLPFARLVGDDRILVEAIHGRLLVRPAPTLTGMLEVRGLGIRRLPYEPVATVGLVVDLGKSQPERLPDPANQRAEIAGIHLPRLAVAHGADAVTLLMAYLHSGDAQHGYCFAPLRDSGLAP
jgi:serine kinase of HPr protein (carbohydrate metabolism regulator)